MYFPLLKTMSGKVGVAVTYGEIFSFYLQNWKKNSPIKNVKQANFCILAFLIMFSIGENFCIWIPEASHFTISCWKG